MPRSRNRTLNEELACKNAAELARLLTSPSGKGRVTLLALARQLEQFNARIEAMEHRVSSLTLKLDGLLCRRTKDTAAQANALVIVGRLDAVTTVIQLLENGDLVFFGPDAESAETLKTWMDDARVESGFMFYKGLKTNIRLNLALAERLLTDAERLYNAARTSRSTAR
jgi:hypothetical protein